MILFGIKTKDVLLAVEKSILSIFIFIDNKTILFGSVFIMFISDSVRFQGYSEHCSALIVQVAHCSGRIKSN